MNIKCPSCGNQGSTHIGSDAFEVRGTWEGKPVRKCLRCGAGMTVGFPKRIKLIEPGVWSQMEGSWGREFGTEDNGADELAEPAEDDDEYPTIECPYCGNTGSSAPGSAAFEYRVALSDPGARMCRRCERGFWLYAETGDTEPMGDEAWAGIEAMHATLGGGASVDAEWARRRAGTSDEEDEAEDSEDESDELDEAPDGTEEPPQVSYVQRREAVRLRGRVEEVVARIVEVQDPAAVDEDGVEPDDGMRYVGVLLRIENTGTEVYFGMPSMESRLVASDGDEYEATVGWLKPDLDDDLDDLQPDQAVEGFITFEVPEGVRLKAFRFVFDEKTPPEAAEWEL